MYTSVKTSWATGEVYVLYTKSTTVSNNGLNHWYNIDISFQVFSSITHFNYLNNQKSALNVISTFMAEEHVSSSNIISNNEESDNNRTHFLYYALVRRLVFDNYQ